MKLLRLRAGMQQKELAIRAGVSRPTVSEWEHGKKDPSGERLKRLSAIFNVDPGVILGFSPAVPTPNETQVFQNDRPQSVEARIISTGIDKLPKEQREQALNVMRVVFAQYADYFKKENIDDDA